MTNRIVSTVIAAAFGMLLVTTVAQAEGGSAPRAVSVDLGTLSGVAYATPEARGQRVVVTLAPRGAAPAVRFEAVLADGQDVTLSVPRAAGAEAETVAIARSGDLVTVTPVRKPAVVAAAGE